MTRERGAGAGSSSMDSVEGAAAPAGGGRVEREAARPSVYGGGAMPDPGHVGHGHPIYRSFRRPSNTGLSDVPAWRLRRASPVAAESAGLGS